MYPRALQSMGKVDAVRRYGECNPVGTLSFHYTIDFAATIPLLMGESFVIRLTTLLESREDKYGRASNAHEGRFGFKD